jgi:hypothetical protein
MQANQSRANKEVQKNQHKQKASTLQYDTNTPVMDI